MFVWILSLLYLFHHFEFIIIIVVESILRGKL